MVLVVDYQQHKALVVMEEQPRVVVVDPLDIMLVFFLDQVVLVLS
tara:strand:- start:371 stop:505 length:135 start_codon:yes stop_codon:yes gene_type:complete